MKYRTLNPATGKVVRTFPFQNWKETQAVLEKGRSAFADWKRTPLAERLRLLGALADCLRQRQSRYGELITLEMGKPVVQAETEIEKCARGCDYYIEHAGEGLQDRNIPSDASRSYVRYDPLGVILGVMPWNFPFWQVFRFAIPALMAGNVVILKHAPSVPGCALALVELFRNAGFPEGVLQSLFLSNKDAARLIESGFVQGVSLTGSDRAGSEVAAAAGKGLVKTVLELGGSDPFIVFEDADIAKAVSVGLRSRMLNTGQSCIAAKRFIVAEKIMPQVQETVVKGVEGLHVGDPMDRATDIGPLAREDLLENLVRQVDRSVADGAKLVFGGGKPAGKGFYYNPAVLIGVRPGVAAFEEEIFGPVVSLISFRTEDEAVALANQTRFGLGAALWTADLARAERLIPEIEAGSVFVNGMVKSDPRLPFGGIKRSGYGRELSFHGLHEFVNVKTVWIG